VGDVEILYLARYYSVSFEVAARRCEQLELIPRGAAIGLYQTISDHHGNPERRADEVGIEPRQQVDIPTSAWLMNLAREKISHGELSIGRAAEILNASKGAILSAGAARA
jgi:hypothetical protein